LVNESSFQKKCMSYLKRKGIVSFNIHGGGWSSKGAPDIISCIQGKFVAFELKVGTNDMQPDQRIWKERIIRNGGQHFCPRTFQEFKNIVDGVMD
jgi:hypothetical protein